MEGHSVKAEEAHKAAVATFTPAAKKADAELAAIAKDPQMPAGQKHEKIEALLKSLPESVRKEFEKASQNARL